MQHIDLWMGTERAAHEFVAKTHAASLYSPPEDDDKHCDEPQLFQLIGNIALIDIKGSLTNNDSWWNSYFGLTSYSHIRNAVVEAANHSSVHTILLNIDSGGGSAAGVTDAGFMISEVAKAKRTVAYTNGSMMSAAYWLGASASEIYASPTASVGSIGVVMVHQDLTKMLSNEGVKVTVLRAGENKARLNPFETLTPAVRADAEAKLEQMRELFAQHVADSRGYPVKYVMETLADGSEFLAGAAAEAGLIDGVTSFDQLIINLQAQASKDLEKTNSQPTYGMESSMAKKRVLTPQVQAQIASGVPVAEALASAPEPTEEPRLEEAPPEEAPVEEEAEQAPVEEAPEAEANANASNGVVTFLQAELSARSKEVLELKLKVADMERQMAAMEGTHASMRQIVSDRVSTMQIAMTGSSLDLSDVSAEVLLKQHDKTLATFQKTFPVGGVAAAPSASEEQDAPKTPAEKTKAQLRAVKFK